MSKNCQKAVKLNIGIAGCCDDEERKKKKAKCKSRGHGCIVLPVCECEPCDCLPEGGDPGDHLVKDEDNTPVWKPAEDCDCEPVEGLPEGGDPGDFLGKDEDNNPVWKPVTKCDCELGEFLPEGGNPGDYLFKDESNNAVWTPGKTTPVAAQTFYFRDDGNDENDGLSNTPSGAFRTAQGGVNKILIRQSTSAFVITLIFSEGNFGPLVWNASALSNTSVIVKGSGISTIFDSNDVALYLLGGICYADNFTAKTKSNASSGGRATVMSGPGSVLHLRGEIAIRTEQDDVTYGWNSLYTHSTGTLTLGGDSNVSVEGNPTNAIVNYIMARKFNTAV